MLDCCSHGAESACLIFGLTVLCCILCVHSARAAFTQIAGSSTCDSRCIHLAGVQSGMPWFRVYITSKDEKR